MSFTNSDAAWHILAMYDGQGNIILHLLTDAPCPQPGQSPLLDTLGCRLECVARGVEAADYASQFPHCLTLTDAFWTCGCKQAYIHHRGIHRCPRCGLTVEQDCMRLPCLGDLLGINPPVN